MATAKIQSFLPYDNSSATNYKTWAQGIGSALSSLGWVLAGDSGQVTWSNVVSIPIGNINYSTTIASWVGAWSGGTSYVAGNTVTSSGLTYVCQIATQTVLTQMVVNLAVTDTIASIAAASGGTTVYTISSDAGAAANAYVGFVFVVSSATNPLNNGTFICTASTATTLTLSNNFGVVQAGTNGTCVSSTSNVGIIGTFNANAGGNAWTGLSFTTTGFAASAGVNNATFTATATSATCIGAAKGSSVNETHAGAATANTAPLSDNGYSGVVTTFNMHWLPYNYEIWVTNGPLSTTAPIYLKLIYGAGNAATVVAPVVYFQLGTTQTNGIIGGNMYNSGTPVGMNNISSGPVNNGGVLVECDFCGTADKVAWILWRGGGNPSVFCIDRAKDQNANDLDTFALVMVANGQQGKSAPVYKVGAGPSSIGLSTAWPCIFDSNNTTNVNGNSAAFMCFPMVGYMANPILGAIAMHANDCAEGNIVNIVAYGGTHTYLMTKTNIISASALPAFSACGIQWEVF